MSKSRNYKLVKECIKRDSRICQCCGFRAHEAHHIVPIICGGEDKLDNMISLCRIDHYYAPNKEGFTEYKNRGGARIDLYTGTMLRIYLKSEIENKSLENFKEFSKNVFDILRKIDIEGYDEDNEIIKENPYEKFIEEK